MAQISGPPSTATRCQPISAELRDILNAAADENGIQRIIITSGGQMSARPPSLKNQPCGWTGSTRHNNGRAADLMLIKDGSVLTFSNSNGDKVSGFITSCAARGATGIGAATDYMGDKVMHIGFGRTPSDTTKLTWGRGGNSVNAPNWLRVAARAGWNNPVSVDASISDLGSGTALSVVIARDGLWLRKGPGLQFEKARLLAAGTTVNVLGLDGEWAKVDLGGDGFADGHVHSAFISNARVVSALESDDSEEEPPLDDETIATLMNDLIDGEHDSAQGNVAKASTRQQRRSRPRPRK